MQMAMDQGALTEQIRGTGRPANVDDLAGSFNRPNGDRPALVPDGARMRCNVSMSRPVTTPGVSRDLYIGGAWGGGGGGG